MLKQQTPLEREIQIKIFQLFYLVKNNIIQIKEIYNTDDKLVYEYFSSLSKTKLFQVHQKCINEIKKETWVDCDPYYFHLSEFLHKLNDQVNDYLKNNKNYSKVSKQILKLQRQQFKNCSLDLLTSLFWFTNTVNY